MRYHIDNNLAKDEHKVVEKRDISISGMSLFGPNVARCSLISESGLYKLIMRAQRINPAVVEFQDWVTKVVLPAIRKDGAYIMGEEKVVTGEMSPVRAPHAVVA